jgi:hypothetical protein
VALAVRWQPDGWLARSVLFASAALLGMVRFPQSVSHEPFEPTGQNRA